MVNMKSKIRLKNLQRPSQNSSVKMAQFAFPVQYFFMLLLEEGGTYLRKNQFSSSMLESYSNLIKII